jgi:L-threonylcarbamoyladenylate synthase
MEGASCAAPETRRARACCTTDTSGVEVERLRLRDLLASPDETSRLRRILQRGGVAAIPTETFYALAADPWSAAGVERIFRIKGRDDGKPLLVLFSERAHLAALKIAAEFGTLETFFGIWPAPLTVVLPLARPIAASRGSAALAVRMPADLSVRGLLSATGPLTGTSANRSGEPALSDPDAVATALGNEIDVLVDGGGTPGGKPSTLLDATRTPAEVLRPGAFPWPPAGP